MRSSWRHCKLSTRLIPAAKPATSLLPARAQDGPSTILSPTTNGAAIGAGENVGEVATGGVLQTGAAQVEPPVAGPVDPQGAVDATAD